ncbi:MAG TPA: hypothetical protein VGG14_16020 [Candidatus Sulfotelmatobacter sp.]|jgi:hypothetical protein
MNPSNYESADQRDPQSDAFDRELDAELASCVNVNPRTGLEDRIMARMAAERKRVDVGMLWRWTAVAFAALSVMLVIAIYLKSSNPLRNEIAGPVRQQLGVPQILSPSPDVSRVRAASSAKPSPHRHIVASLPKLEQFPSPQPLSEQEKVLADYVARFRNEAVLIAQVNTEELMRERAQMAESSGANMDSTEPSQKETTNR